MFFLIKVIQVISAVDADDPAEGHHFYFSVVPDKNINPNFTIRDNQGAVHHTVTKYIMTSSSLFLQFIKELLLLHQNRFRLS